MFFGGKPTKRTVRVINNAYRTDLNLKFDLLYKKVAAGANFRARGCSIKSLAFQISICYNDKAKQNSIMGIGSRFFMRFFCLCIFCKGLSTLSIAFKLFSHRVLIISV